ncbi:GNAT family N-acetyltransferase [Paenibacillus sp. CAU 1782]
MSRGTAQTGIPADGKVEHTDGNADCTDGKAEHPNGNVGRAGGKDVHANGNAGRADGKAEHPNGNVGRADGKAEHPDGNAGRADGKADHPDGNVDHVNKDAKTPHWLIRNDCKDREWDRVAELMQYFGLSAAPPETHRQTFENSYAVTFIYDGESLIGFGRALSDGVSQAAIYNIAVDERYHGKGLGRLIIENLLTFVGHCNVVLYTHPDTVDFYRRLGFKSMKTGLALYRNEPLLKEMGFID